MKFTVQFQPSIYFFGDIKLWFARFYGRMFRQRLKLTLLIIMVLLVLYLISQIFLFIFVILAISTILMDFYSHYQFVLNKIKTAQTYVTNDEVEFSIYAGKHFCLIHNSKQQHNAEWDNIFEYCRLNTPKLLSFKDKESKNLYIIYQDEIGKENFLTLKNIIENNIKVIPLF